jgi:hypothetical protein
MRPCTLGVSKPTKEQQMQTVQLYVPTGWSSLCLPGEQVLLTYLRGGDPVTAWWPLVDKVYEPFQAGYTSSDGIRHWSEGSRYHARATLAACLLDANEVGDLPDGCVVLLPDGTPFDWQSELGGPLYSTIPAPAL